MRLLLVQPPLTDPTCGCAALPALSAYIRTNSDYEVDCADANLESIYYLTRPSQVAPVLERATAELTRIQRKRTIGNLSPDSMNKRLIDIHLATTLSENDPECAINIFRDPVAFYDYEAYYWAAVTLKKWLGALSPPEIPSLYADFSLRPDVEEINLWNIKKLLHPDTLYQVTGAFDGYIDDLLLDKIRHGDYHVVGITIGMYYQLPFAIRICRKVRQELPNVRLLLGGAAISQMWKFGHTTGAAQRVLAEADALVIGDGEPAIVGILDAFSAGRPLDTIPNTVCDLNSDNFHDRQYVNLSDIPSPAVEDLPLSSYLSPEPTVLYAPTRGCYWNRCAFCDYGLSQNSPASPWRQRPIEAAVEDLKQLQKYARMIYFSVDAISPKYLYALAKEIISQGLEVRWATEVRLEAPVREDYFKTLRDSGCVAVAVGFESGNQRVLDLMDKGIRVDRMVSNIRDMAGAGIVVQIMGFTGFPTETFEEAAESVKLLNKIKDSWLCGGLGTFQLTAGSIVAKEPDRFNIHNLRPRPDDDLPWGLLYDEVKPFKTPEEQKEIEELVTTLKRPFELSRPFVGGNNSPHTLMYAERYSVAMDKEFDKAVCGEAFDTSMAIMLGGTLSETWPESVPEEENSEKGGETYFVSDDRTVIQCGSAVALIASLLQSPRSMSEILDEILAKPDIERHILMRGFEELMKRNFVRAVPAHVLRVTSNIAQTDD